MENHPPKKKRNRMALEVKKKSALITGITGQDGAYLAEFLLKKGYDVHGSIRRTSLPNTERLEKLLGSDWEDKENLHLHDADLVDTSSIYRMLEKAQPDEIYNLGAQSHVAVSFDQPEYTANSDALGTLRILEAIKNLELSQKSKFYQASTSELFGLVQESPQTERTPFYPRSPYAVAKLYSYWITINYREAYGIFACNGILFNHESPLRGVTFVTRKITIGLAQIKLGIKKCLMLGNLNSLRDWGHARDYIEMQWAMLQCDQPKDFVIATGMQHSVRDFINLACGFLGINISWQGDGIDEVGIDQNGNVIVAVDSRLFRPAEVETLLGDASLAKEILGWEASVSFENLVEEMTMSDYENQKRLSSLL